MTESRRGMTISAPLCRRASENAACAMVAPMLSVGRVSRRSVSQRSRLTRLKPWRISCWNTIAITTVVAALTADSRYDVRISPE